MATSNSRKQNKDLISNVLDILPDEILQHLPIRDAARTSVLSKQWRCNWLSLNRLVFDEEFFQGFYYEDGSWDWKECSNVISSILLNHDGPIHEFNLYIPPEEDEKFIKYLAQWLSFLSKNQVKCVNINNCNDPSNDYPFPYPISSNIFWCSELIHLELHSLTLRPTPSSFSGFPKLQHLVMSRNYFSQKGILNGLIAMCRKLVTLSIDYCEGMGDIVIDLPSLETLAIIGDYYESIAFRDVCNLKSIQVREVSLDSVQTLNIEGVESLKYLARSCQLQCINFEGDMCKYLAGATASIKRSIPVAFNHLTKLTLDSLDLSSLGVLQNICDMVECCPFMKKLDISISMESCYNCNYQKLEINKVYKSPRLLEVKMRCMRGADLEIQLIEYLLTIAVALERFSYRFSYLRYGRDTETHMKLSKILLGIPRASPKARLVRLK